MECERQHTKLSFRCEKGWSAMCPFRKKGDMDVGLRNTAAGINPFLAANRR